MVVKKAGETDLKLKFVWGFFLRTAHKSWMLLLAIRKNNTCVEELLLKLENVGEKKVFLILYRYVDEQIALQSQKYRTTFGWWGE